MIHDPDPQSRPVVITISACVVCPSVCIVIATGRTVGLAEWIIDGTHVLLKIYISALNRGKYKQTKPNNTEKSWATNFQLMMDFLTLLRRTLRNMQKNHSPSEVNLIWNK